ncbi:MAG TPA: hypothetical protein PKA02_02470 [Candidatus Saccharibacteria bacterium]|nr:hypothetical protein [Candidatus Saccharibacteria bacterium]
MPVGEGRTPEAHETGDEIAGGLILALMRRGAESGELCEVPQHVRDIAAIALQPEPEI